MATSHTLISLFAGAGGLDLGLEMAGFKAAAVNELGPHACETLRQNKVLGRLAESEFDEWFSSQIEQQKCYANQSQEELSALKARIRSATGSHSFLSAANIVEGDIRTTTTQELLTAARVQAGELTLVAGGPPCQPFSRAGKRETVETEDGRLFLEFVRTVKEALPRWFLFENVKGLAQSKTLVPYYRCNQCRGVFIAPFKVRNDVLAEGKVSLSCPACQSNHCGLEPKEVRGGSLDIILNEFRSIGYRCHHKILNAADYGVPQSRERLFIVGSRDNESFEWPRPTHSQQPMNTNGKSEGGWSQSSLFSSAETSLRPWRTVQDVLWQAGHPKFGQLDYSKAVIWVKNVVRPHAEPVCWSLNRPSPTVGAHQGAKLAIAPDGVPEEQLARQQWHTQGRRQRDLPPVSVEHSMLSDEELLLLQTFPANWYLYGTRMERAFQIGNAVPPLLAMAVGRAILKACETNQPAQPYQPTCEAVE